MIDGSIGMDMNRSDPDVPGNRSQPHPDAASGSSYIPDANQVLWQQFAEATTPEAYYRSWLALQCRMIRGVSGGVVVLGAPDSGRFVPVAFWPDGQRNIQYLAEAAERALTERHGLFLKQVSQETPGTPLRERYHVAYPIQMEGRLYGVVALDIASRPESQLQGVVRQLQWGAAWLEVLFHRMDASNNVVTQERLQTVFNLIATALQHERFYGAASAFVTDLATRLTCDRVSLGFVHGSHMRVQMVSHSAQFRKKTNLIRAIESAMEEALDQEAAIVYPAMPDSTFQITRAHEELARQHGAGAVCSIPLSRDGQISGVLTLERPADNSFDTSTVELCEAVAALAGPMLELKQREDRWLVTKAAQAFQRQLTYVIGPRHVALKLAIVSLVAVITFFAVAKTDYRVAATTVIEAAIQRAAVAPFAGYIADARVRAGDLVHEGDLLCTLDDRDLRLERLKWASQKQQFIKQYQQALAQHNTAQGKIITAQIDQVTAQLALVDDQLSRARVIAPFDGVIVTGDLSQSIGAPVERGQVLFEVAPLNAYRIILQVDERDVGEVAVGQRGHLLLSASPTEYLAFTVEKITPVSTAREGRNYFRVEAQLERATERLRPGMEGVGKIEIDRRKLIWIWTHQAIDWLRLLFWSWSP